MTDANILRAKDSEAHDSALLHITGESLYIDDRPAATNEVFVGLITSPYPHADIEAIDYSEALNDPNVLCVLDASYVQHNAWGAIFCEQPIIASGSVNFVGEVVAIFAVTKREKLMAVKNKIKVHYRLKDPILSIEEARAKKSFIGDERSIIRGDLEEGFKLSHHRLAGTIELRGADHFYLENQSALAYPLEDNQMEVHSSTQHPTETQQLVAEALGIPFSDVNCVTKRLGGGFGGKETQAAPFAAYAAMVAKKLHRPARLVLTKDEDMLMTGKRNPYLVNYEVGFDDQGKIHALDCYFYGDGGAYADLSTAILERAMAHADNAYYIPHIKIAGRVCRTNVHPHTAFRGFGGPKGVAMIEHIMEEVGHYLGQDALDIRMSNCYRQDNNITPYGQRIKDNTLPELFKTLEQSCSYRQRRAELNRWNEDPNNNPRGMSLTAIKFGIAFTTRFLNQGYATVHVQRDGSVQVSTGAVEMGQGVHARIKQLLTDELGIAKGRVRLLATATEKNANTSPTAASSGTDLNGTAAVLAARKIKERLAALAVFLLERPRDLWPKNTAGLATTEEFNFIAKESGSWSASLIFRDGNVYHKENGEKKIALTELIENAYLSRLTLSEMGHYCVPHLGFNKITGQGDAFLYFTNGVACSEVEIDRFSGEAKVLRSDILMDVGRPINDALDRGQITGAFIQGLGWVMTESLHYEGGVLKSISPSTYKIPSVHDIPRTFNIDLLSNEQNRVNIAGTKAVGEPPLMLAFSVWNAFKDAIAYKKGKKKFSRIESLPVPATQEALLKALRPELF